MRQICDKQQVRKLSYKNIKLKAKNQYNKKNKIKTVNEVFPEILPILLLTISGATSFISSQDEIVFV